MSVAAPSAKNWRRRSVRGENPLVFDRGVEAKNPPHTLFLRRHDRFDPAADARQTSRTKATTSPDIRFNHPTPLVTAHGCLLIPFAFGFWWYWTKRTARRMVSGLLTYTGNPEFKRSSSVAEPTENDMYRRSEWNKSDELSSPTSDADMFYSWDDVIDQESPDDNTLRFVRWFKSNETKVSSARRRVHAATLNNLRRGPSVDPVLSMSQSSEDTDTFHATFSNASKQASALTWQCIRCTTTTGGTGLCFLISRSFESSETLLSNEEILARSASTYGIVETVSSGVTYA